MAAGINEQYRSLMGRDTRTDNSYSSSIRSPDQTRDGIRFTNQIPHTAQNGQAPEPVSTPPRGMMRGFKREIIGGMVLMFLPLPLMAVLVGLIYANREASSTLPGSADSITIDGSDRPLDSNYYLVSYSATRLAFISSLAATLALALVPVAMPLLYAYVAASSLQNASLLRQHDKLPSPFQFELLLRMLAGGTLDIFLYLDYLFRRKRSRIAAVPLLNKVAMMLSFMLLLALGVTIADAFFHIKTISVQYHSSVPYQQSDFLPGRRLPIECWNDTDEFATGYACNYIPGGSGAASSFTNSTEGYLTLGNQSTHNAVRLADDGSTAIIVPPTSPNGVSFTAKSFASSTTCETVTKKCHPQSNATGDCTACQAWIFNCTKEDAGFVWLGDFGDTVSAAGASGNVAYAIQYFNTSDRTTNGSDVGGLQNATDGRFSFSLLFQLPRGLTPDLTNNNMDPDMDMAYDPINDIVANTYGIEYGILLCETQLSEASYLAALDGSIHAPVLTPMNTSATKPFIQPLAREVGGRENLLTGINLAAANAVDREDLAAQFARLYDRTLLGLVAGLLPDREPVGAVQQETKQVARVPIPELMVLLVLNLLYPVIGVALGVWALLLCRKQGVRDVQARLGMAAMVSAAFEDPAFNESAARVKELYAEMRGLPTARVAVGEGGGGSKVLVGVLEGEK